MSPRFENARSLSIAALLALALAAQAEPLTFAELQAKGVPPLNADQALALVSGARVRYTPPSGGHFRRWQLREDGVMTVTSIGNHGHAFDYQGTWSVRPDGSLCVAIHWGAMSTENWCRLLYPVDDAYFIFSRLAKPETLGAAYYFSK